MRSSNAQPDGVKSQQKLELVDRDLRVDSAGSALCPHCDKRIDPLALRDQIVVKLMDKLLHLRARLAELDPSGQVI